MKEPNGNKNMRAHFNAFICLSILSFMKTNSFMDTILGSLHIHNANAFQVVFGLEPGVCSVWTNSFTSGAEKEKYFLQIIKKARVTPNIEHFSEQRVFTFVVCLAISSE